MTRKCKVYNAIMISPEGATGDSQGHKPQDKKTSTKIAPKGRKEEEKCVKEINLDVMLLVVRL